MADGEKKSSTLLLAVGGLVMLLFLGKKSGDTGSQQQQRPPSQPGQPPPPTQSQSGSWDCNLQLAGGSFFSGYSGIRRANIQLQLPPGDPPPAQFFKQWFDAMNYQSNADADFCEFWGTSEGVITVSGIIEKNGESWTVRANSAGENYTDGTHGIPATSSIPWTWNTDPGVVFGKAFNTITIAGRPFSVPVATLTVAGDHVQITETEGGDL
jgi:hypothetical protein